MSAPIAFRALGAADIHRLLSYENCIAAVEHAMRETSLREVNLPLRQIMGTPGSNGWFGVMPGSMNNPGNFGVKLISLYPGNPAIGLSSHLGLYILYEAEHGRPLAVLEAGALTAIRTAAATAVATKYLARKNARRLTIIGTGEEAETHLKALACVREFNEVTIWGRSPDKVKAFIARHQVPGGPKLTPAVSIEEAVKGADVICTVTAASEPILFGRTLEPGQHVNLVGASTADKAEADSECVTRSRFFVDYRESTMAQAGEFLRALKEGAVTEDHIQGEIGAVINGDKPGRTGDEEITVYKSLGIAAQDLVAAVEVLKRAEDENSGQMVHL